MTVVDGTVDATTYTVAGAITILSPSFADDAGTPTDLTGVAMLAAENLFTADQRIDLNVPVTPVADAATTQPTTFLHLHMPDDGDVLTEFIGFAVDFGGGTLRRFMGTAIPAADTNGNATDVWEVSLFGYRGQDGDDNPTYRRGGLHVTSSTPGEMPSILDIISSAPAPVAVGPAVLHDDAVQLQQLEDAVLSIDAENVDVECTGLLAGLTHVEGAILGIEAVLDRPLYVAGMSITTNVDITATNPPMEFGDCVAYGYVWLNGQTDPDENATYQVNADLTLTRKVHPDVFEPPGNGAKRSLLAPGEPEHGLTYTWFNDDRTLFWRAGAVPQEEAPDSGWSGTWVKTFDPTDTGGGGAVDSVNGDTGTVVLTAADVGADPAGSAATAQAAAIAASQPLRPWKAAVGDWATQPRGTTATGTQTLNLATYVPYPIPLDWNTVDGISAYVTVVAASALCRLGLYLPNATTGLPDTLLVDGGTVDFSSGGGAAGARTLTIPATAVTPGSLIYVAVVPQGATAQTLMTSLEGLRMYGHASSTVLTAYGNPVTNAYTTAGVSGALASAPAITKSTNTTAQPVVALRRAS